MSTPLGILAMRALAQNEGGALDALRNPANFS